EHELRLRIANKDQIFAREIFAFAQTEPTAKDRWMFTHQKDKYEIPEPVEPSQEDANKMFEHNGPFTLTIPDSVQEDQAREIADKFPNVNSLAIWSHSTDMQKLRFIGNLCRLMGDKLHTLKLW